MIKDVEQQIKRHRETEYNTAVCNHYQFAGDVEYLLSLVKQHREVLEVEFANENNWEMVEITRHDGMKIKIPSWKWGLEPWKLAQQALKE